MSSLIEKLRADYGDRVQDVFQGTNLAEAASKMKFGLYVVRGAYKQDMAKKAMVDVVELLNDTSVSKVGAQWKPRGANFGIGHYRQRVASVPASTTMRQSRGMLYTRYKMRHFWRK